RRAERRDEQRRRGRGRRATPTGDAIVSRRVELRRPRRGERGRPARPSPGTPPGPGADGGSRPGRDRDRGEDPAVFPRGGAPPLGPAPAPAVPPGCAGGDPSVPTGSPPCPLSRAPRPSPRQVLARWCSLRRAAPPSVAAGTGRTPGRSLAPLRIFRRSTPQ